MASSKSPNDNVILNTLQSIVVRLKKMEDRLDKQDGTNQRIIDTIDAIYDAIDKTESDEEFINDKDEDPQKTPEDEKEQEAESTEEDE